jgi:hypothetical protein
MYRFVFTSAVIASTLASVSETWKRTDAALENVNDKFDEVRRRADAAMEVEKKTLLDAKRAAEKSGEVLEHLGEPIRDPEASLQEEEAAVKELKLDDTDSSSFLEIPDELKKFPGVEADMKRAQEAERVFKEKMKNLHTKDEELMAFARSNFASSRDAVKLIGHLRSRAPRSSFLEGFKLPPAFAKVREAQEELRQVNEKLKKQFHLQ